jgi:oxygen-independent coproporphyrinogen-3 oxidase
MGIEIHPGVTSIQQIKDLSEIGFNRLSIGIQDFSPLVLEKINRKQTFEETRDLVLEAKRCGFNSINFDLVYGLPFQKAEHIQETINKVVALKPDRIAFYGYAHVPWKSKGQRHFTENDLADPAERWSLFELGSSLLQKSGFHLIGLDHFARNGDPLLEASMNGKLHRNFMGYTDQNSDLLIGLGASAIGESPDAFAQNSPDIDVYLHLIKEGKWPIVKGHRLNAEDKTCKEKIMQLMCNGETFIDFRTNEGLESKERLEEMEGEGLITLQGDKIKITSLGHPFMRNICLMLDHRHWAKSESKSLFSAAV